MLSIGPQLENVWGAILYSLLVICLSNYGMDSATGNKRHPPPQLPLCPFLSVHTHTKTLTHGLQLFAPCTDASAKLNGRFSDSRRVVSAGQGLCVRADERV